MNIDTDTVSPLRILHLEDSHRDADLIREYLACAGLSIRVDWATNEREFTAFLHHGEYDLILADYRLPDFDAPAALLLAKSLSGVPFIAVTGAVGEEEAVDLLKQGATDYVLKHRLDKLPLAIARALAEFKERQARRQAEAAMRASEAKYRNLFEGSSDALYVALPDGRVADANRRCLDMFGYDSNELGAAVHLTRDIYANPADRQRVLSAVDKNGSCDCELVLKKRNGDLMIALCTVTTERDEAGKIKNYRGSIRDISERYKADEQQRIAATAFEAQEGIVITDADQVILRANRAFTEITGYLAEEVVGATPRLLSSGRHDKAFYREMWDCIRATGFWQGEVSNRRKNGELFPGWLNITAVRNPHGEVTHYVGTLNDITARKAAERQIEHLAFYDLLTELPNRRLLMDRLQHAMAGSARSRRMGALLFIDLDNFKMLNDTSGHDVGDRLLIEVANRLRTCVRDGDTISRLGGDEFLVMLEDLSEDSPEAAAQAKAVGETIMADLNQAYVIAGRVHHSTSSIGATLFVDTENPVDELLKQADIAMYQAKAAGRNTLRFFDPDVQASLTARASIEADLRLGIEERQFVLHYQPQVDGQGHIIGAEALLRWQHPERGTVSPAQFIPIAEDTGLILPVGQWVLEEACARLAAWSRLPHARHLQLAVNVSARQFRQPDFVDRVRGALETSHAPTTLLKLELTESLVLDDVDDTIEKMRALKKLGVGFSMDDFGTGYSSLSYLTRLPLDQIKIDQSFVRNLPDNPTDAVVVQSIITLAGSLGLVVIAEGVETEAQRQFLEQHGCPTFQGYLFSKPVAVTAFDDLLTRRYSATASEQLEHSRLSGSLI